ncbi:MAG: hypothetical protein V4805_06325 [Pseudomonadota bacterium]
MQHTAPAQGARSQPEALSAAGMHRGLVVGVKDIPDKEQLVLRSLLRVMDGKNDLKLTFSDTLSDCNVVLVPAHWTSRLPPTCVSVHLIPEDAPADTAHHPGLSIRAPLRLTNTSILLRAAAELLAHGAALLRSPNGLAPLLDTLLRHIMSRERRITVLPLKDGREIIVNFLDDRYYSLFPVEELLKGRFSLDEPRRASDAEIAALVGQEGGRLRELLWLATNRLSDSTEPGATLSGHFRLLRWPDTMALTRPGFPMLAALLTSRPQTIEKACAASGASVTAISWFLRTNLALGIAESVETFEAPEPALNLNVPHADPAPSMLSRIRERLKLW